ncbi:unnamed protein product [Symbiodinium microadriaticum]|nr:unnamed protein product [Symbiodinium microadriaticum]
MPNCEECAAKLWSGNNRALWFLVWLELLILPRCCSRGHEWKFPNGNDNEDGSYCHLHCTARLQEVFPASEEDDEKAPTHKRCNYKKTWRNQSDLPYFLPASMTPSQYLRTLYWFSSDAPQKQVLKETGLAETTWAKIRNKIRDLLWLVIQQQFNRVQLGGPGRVVVIDETFCTRKKTNAGGFVGRSTMGNKTIVMGFLELDLATRKATGACVLITIANRKQATLKREIETHVLPGSPIFTDRHKSYHFLDADKASTCTELSTTRLVSSPAWNAYLVRYLRQREYLRIGKRAYGEVLAEFLWRQKCSAFRVEPFYNLLREIKVW